MPFTINQDGATIGTQINVDGTLNMGAVPLDPAALEKLRAHLGTLRLEISEAQRRGEIPPRVAEQAQGELAKATVEAKKDQPQKATIREHLDGAKILIESLAAAGGLVTTFTAAAEAVQKLLP